MSEDRKRINSVTREALTILYAAEQAIDMVAPKLNNNDVQLCLSELQDILASVELQDRTGKRVIVKIKARDFE